MKFAVQKNDFDAELLSSLQALSIVVLHSLSSKTHIFQLK
jgi:hypothetical protein